MIHASSLFGYRSFKIKTYMDKHNCQWTRENNLVMATWISFKMADWFKSHVNCKIDEMVTELKKEKHIWWKLKDRSFIELREQLWLS